MEEGDEDERRSDIVEEGEEGLAGGVDFRLFGRCRGLIEVQATYI